MKTIYGELYEINVLVQKNHEELIEMVSLVAVPTEDKALAAFMEINNIHATLIIKSKVTFVRYVICAI